MSREPKTTEVIPATMRAIRQQERGGTLYIEEVPVPLPGPGEVLVKMAASPVNPSDLANLAGDYLTGSWPVTPGLEGSGTIVASGGGILSSLRLGKRVACTPIPGGEGTWAGYMRTSVTRTIPLPSGTGMEQGAMWVVNPMTALAFIHLCKRGGHAAIIHNAAGSALGNILIRMAQRNRIPLISIVRRKEQLKALAERGAEHVLDSSDPGFDTELGELAAKMKATLVLDAVTGKETGRLLAAAPPGSTLVAYARLSGDPIRADPAELIRHGKQIIGFQLGNWLDTKGMLFKLRFLKQLKRELSDPSWIRIHRTYPMEQVEEAIRVYRDEMSGGKVILTMHDHP